MTEFGHTGNDCPQATLRCILRLEERESVLEILGNGRGTGDSRIQFGRDGETARILVDFQLQSGGKATQTRGKFSLGGLHMANGFTGR